MLDPLGEQTRRLIDLYPKIFFACHTRHVRDPVTHKEVSERQVQILDHLDEREATTLTGLAQHLGVTASTMSLAVDRLERARYVRRHRDPRDGRRVGVRLTAAGARVREEHSVLDPELVRALLGGLSADAREEALRGLARLADAARSVRGARVGLGREHQRSTPDTAAHARPGDVS